MKLKSDRSPGETRGRMLNDWKSGDQCLGRLSMGGEGSVSVRVLRGGCQGENSWDESEK